MDSIKRTATKRETIDNMIDKSGISIRYKYISTFLLYRIISYNKIFGSSRHTRVPNFSYINAIKYQLRYSQVINNMIINKNMKNNAKIYGKRIRSIKNE